MARPLCHSPASNRTSDDRAGQLVATERLRGASSPAQSFRPSRRGYWVTQGTRLHRRPVGGNIGPASRSRTRAPRGPAERDQAASLCFRVDPGVSSAAVRTRGWGCAIREVEHELAMPRAARYRMRVKLVTHASLAVNPFGGCARYRSSGRVERHHGDMTRAGALDAIRPSDDVRVGPDEP
jgi:hypothetical protein